MKQFMILVALIAGVNIASAQQRGGFQKDPEARAKAQVEKLEKELSLKPEQKDSIHVWILSQAQEQQAAFKAAGQDRSQLRADMKARYELTDSKISAILDDTQKQKYAELKEERLNKMEARAEKGNRPRGKRK